MSETELIEHELFTLRRMIEQLPQSLSTLLLGQLQKLTEAIVARDRAFKARIHENVEDAILAVKLQEFDLEATRREREALQERLDDAS